jgi:hypothetical protein
MARDINVKVGESMAPFFLEVTKAFAEHSGTDEMIRAHSPETHGHESLHSQIMLINKSNGNAFKMRFDR